MKKRQVKISKKPEVNHLVSKWTFIFLMVLIFFSLTFFSSSNTNTITTYSVLETVNPGANFAIFSGLLALVFFLTYEKRKKSK